MRMTVVFPAPLGPRKPIYLAPANLQVNAIDGPDRSERADQALDVYGVRVFGIIAH